MALKSLADVNGRVVAVVSVAAIAAGCVFAFAAGQLRLFQRGYEMTGIFKDTGGLKAGQDVRVAGVKAGRVTSVRPDFGTGRIVIRWKVDAGIRLGSDTRAEVQTTTLLGGRYLRLVSRMSRPLVEDLPHGRRVVPIERTSVPFTVTDALESGTNLASKLDQKALDKLLTEAMKINPPSSPQMRRMLADFRELAASLNDSAPDIDRLIDDSEKITGTLAAKDAQLKRIIDASQVLLRSLIKRRDELAATLGEGSRTVRTLSNVIAKNQRELDTLLTNLHLLTKRVAPNMDALNTDFALLGPTMTQVAGVKGNGPWLEGLLTGLWPLQPPGPISTRRPQGGGS